MSILVDQNTRVLIQGLTGREGQFHAQQMIEYGTKVVAGVTPGKGGTEALGVPVFDTVRDAVTATGANAACIFVPARFAMDAVFEDIDAGLDLVVAITDGIPTQDMIKVVNAIRPREGTDVPHSAFRIPHSKTRLIGPNCPGITSAGKCKIGIMPGNIFRPGKVGVISRSGTLTYEIVDELSRAGLGQTTCIGIGGDPILGMRFVDALPLFDADPETEAVVLVGEIGGSDEEIASEYIKTMGKPVVGFISGRTAPPGKRMGHAGAIISGRTGTAEAKLEALNAAGVPVAETTQEIPELVGKALRSR
jgi:succinyl-CoA synthetase alpha subunit